MYKYIILLVIGFLLVGCSDEDSPGQRQDASETAVKPVRVHDREQLLRGRKLYLKNCTVCHGINAEGAQQWQQRLSDGTYPPPPLNGTGHAWHHPQRVLLDTIKHGTARLGGKMPAWKDKLSDQDINDIISWFQSQWPDELYEAWYRRDKQDRQR